MVPRQGLDPIQSPTGLLAAGLTSPSLQGSPAGGHPRQVGSPTVPSPWGHGPLSPRCCFVVASSQLLHGNIETLLIGASPKLPL